MATSPGTKPSSAASKLATAAEQETAPAPRHRSVGDPGRVRVLEPRARAHQDRRPGQEAEANDRHGPPDLLHVRGAPLQLQRRRRNGCEPPRRPQVVQGLRRQLELLRPREGVRHQHKKS